MPTTTNENVSIQPGLNMEFIRCEDKPFEEGVRRAAEIGYRLIEPMVHNGRELLSEAGYFHSFSMDNDPLEMKEIMDRHGVRASGLSAHTPLMRPENAHCYSAGTVMEFEPAGFQQTAGLVCYYNGSKFHYLYVSRDEEIGKHIRVWSCIPDQMLSDVFGPPVAIPDQRPVQLRVEVDFERLYFAYRTDGGEWQRLPGPLDASILSDEAAAPGTPNFTGAFVGVCCQDNAGTLEPADFDYFLYRERSYRANPLAA